MKKFNIESYLPVKNLVTLSLVQAGNISAQFTGKAISRNLLFPLIIHHRAFFKTDIAKGEWKIMLNVHSVSCDVEYKLVIEGEE